MLPLHCVKFHLEEAHEGTSEGAHYNKDNVGPPKATILQVPNRGGVPCRGGHHPLLPLGHTLCLEAPPPMFQSVLGKQILHPLPKNI